MNDEKFIESIVGNTPIPPVQGAKLVKNVQNKMGYVLERYINSKCSKYEKYVGKTSGSSTPIKGVDYITYPNTSIGRYTKQLWSVKNAWNTDNSSSIGYRSSLPYDICHWYRLNSDGTTNWDSFFIESCNEEEYLEFFRDLYTSGELDKPKKNTRKIKKFTIAKKRVNLWKKTRSR